MLFILQRLSYAVLLLFILSVLVFFGVYLIGNPVDLLVAPDATAHDIVQIEKMLGLDGSTAHQYIVFIKGFFAGEVGQSFIYKQSPWSLIFARLPASLELAICAFFLALILGIPLGMYAALRRNKLFGRLIYLLSTLGVSVPIYWLALLLVALFAVFLHWLPSIGRGDTRLGTSLLTVDGLQHLVLPVISLMLIKLSLVIRLSRAYTYEEWHKNYVLFARARGLSKMRVTLRHIFKNMLVPISTIMSLEFGNILLFAVIIEIVFAWPGLGKLLIDSVFYLDRPVIVAFVLLIGMFYIIMNLVIDVLHIIIDPRLKISKREVR
jgi:peptide/nickel transport system permease protein